MFFGVFLLCWGFTRKTFKIRPVYIDAEVKFFSVEDRGFLRTAPPLRQHQELHIFPTWGATIIGLYGVFDFSSLSWNELGFLGYVHTALEAWVECFTSTDVPCRRKSVLLRVFKNESVQECCRGDVPTPACDKLVVGSEAFKHACCQGYLCVQFGAQPTQQRPSQTLNVSVCKRRFTNIITSTGSCSYACKRAGAAVWNRSLACSENA